MLRALLLLMVLSTHAAGQDFKSYRGTSNDWSPFHSDKSKHIAVGAIIGASAWAVAEKRGYKYPILHGLFWSLLVGAIKENYDKNHGGRPEYADVFWTGAGALLVAIPIKITKRPNLEYAKAPKLEP
jgi:uncharacterized protein YfiM (DUF2279 family)